MKKIKLFCFPYAGGSASIYNKWKPFIGNEIELIPVELAGRGRRIYEEHYDSIDDAIKDVYEKVLNSLEDDCSQRFAFYGHSMGGIIAFELAHKFKEEKNIEPIKIFFSGRSAPHVEREEDKIYHKMSDEDFRENVLELGGTPREFFEHPELLEFFLPLLKNDFKLAETHSHKKDKDKFNFNITILSGDDDDVKDAEEWQQYTDRNCDIHYFKGGHFFIHEHTKEIVKLINEKLKKY